MPLDQERAQTLASVTTLAELLLWRVRRSPGAIAYRQFEPAKDTWIDYNWRELALRIDSWRLALVALGLERGARVAILLPNSVDAVTIDQAALAEGYVPVPLHVVDNPGSLAYILADCEASVLVLRDLAEWQRIAAAGTELPLLKTVVCLDGQVAPAPPVIGLDDWIEAGKSASGAARMPPLATDLAAIVYTSGTTGKPKGVMLTHANVVANVKGCAERLPLDEGDVFLSFLPLSHTFERTAGYYLPMAAGCTVAYVRSIGQIAEDLMTIRPHALVSVPRIYERFYAALLETLASGPSWKRSLFDAALALGWRRFQAAQGLARPGLLGLAAQVLWPVLEGPVARPVLARFGGRLKVAVSGGAALSAAVSRCFLGLGLPVVQGYGMTETSPVIAVNTLTDNWPETVGRPLANVEVRIGENDELQVRGPSIMRGYWKRAAETAQAFTEDSWLKTGDQADWVEGRIHIKGRIKEIIVTSTGEKIAPADLETAILADPLFDQVFVLGENRPFLAAFVVLNSAAWVNLAPALGVAPGAPGLTDPKAQSALLEHIRATTRTFPSYAVPRVVRATLEPWTIEAELMTPTLKIKRKKLELFYAHEIEAIYAGHGVH